MTFSRISPNKKSHFFLVFLIFISISLILANPATADPSHIEDITIGLLKYEQIPQTITIDKDQILNQNTLSKLLRVSTHTFDWFDPMRIEVKIGSFQAESTFISSHQGEIRDILDVDLISAAEEIGSPIESGEEYNIQVNLYDAVNEPQDINLRDSRAFKLVIAQKPTPTPEIILEPTPEPIETTQPSPTPTPEIILQPAPAIQRPEGNTLVPGPFQFKGGGYRPLLLSSNPAVETQTTSSTSNNSSFLSAVSKPLSDLADSTTSNPIVPAAAGFALAGAAAAGSYLTRRKEEKFEIRAVQKQIPVTSQVTEYLNTKIEEAYEYPVEVKKTIKETVMEKFFEPYTVTRLVPRNVVEYVTEMVPVKKQAPRTVWETVTTLVTDIVYQTVQIVRQAARTVWYAITSWIPQWFRGLFGWFTRWIPVTRYEPRTEQYSYTTTERRPVSKTREVVKQVQRTVYDTITQYVPQRRRVEKTVWDTVKETRYREVQRPVIKEKVVTETEMRKGIRMVEREVPEYSTGEIGERVPKYNLSTGSSKLSFSPLTTSSKVENTIPRDTFSGAYTSQKINDGSSDSNPYLDEYLKGGGVMPALNTLQKTEFVNGKPVLKEGIFSSILNERVKNTGEKTIGSTIIGGTIKDVKIRIDSPHQPSYNGKQLLSHVNVGLKINGKWTPGSNALRDGLVNPNSVKGWLAKLDHFGPKVNEGSSFGKFIKSSNKATESFLKSGTGKAVSGVAKGVGTVAVVGAVAIDFINIGNAYKEDGNKWGDNTTKVVGSSAGGWVGAVVGAAATGAAIGSIVPGAGTVVGAIVGGVAGAIIGSGIGESIAKPAANGLGWVADRAGKAASALANSAKNLWDSVTGVFSPKKEIKKEPVKVSAKTIQPSQKPETKQTGNNKFKLDSTQKPATPPKKPQSTTPAKTSQPKQTSTSPKPNQQPKPQTSPPKKQPVPQPKPKPKPAPKPQPKQNPSPASKKSSSKSGGGRR